MSLAKGFSVLFIFSGKQLLISLMFYISLSLYFCSNFTSFLFLTFSSFSNFFFCVRLLCLFAIFLIPWCRPVSPWSSLLELFLLHSMIWNFVFLFSLTKVLFPHWCTVYLLAFCLISVCLYLLDFFFLLLISSCIHLWSKKILGIISVFLSLFSLVLWPNMWIYTGEYEKNVFPAFAHEKNVYFVIFSALYISNNSRVQCVIKCYDFLIDSFSRWPNHYFTQGIKVIYYHCITINLSFYIW